MVATYGTAAQSFEAPALAPAPSLFGGSASPTASQLIGLQSRRSRTVKRAGDIVFSLAVLSLGSPVFLALGLLVKLTSRGPVFYVQQRVMVVLDPRDRGAY